MTLSFASRRAKPCGSASFSSRKDEARSDTKQASRDARATDAIAGDDNSVNAKLASSRGGSDTAAAAAAADPSLNLESDDDVIPVLRAHVAQYASRDNWRGAQISAVTFVFFVATALAPWLLTSRLSAAAGALGFSPQARLASAALLWAAWGILRAGAYVRSFMLVRIDLR